MQNLHNNLTNNLASNLVTNFARDLINEYATYKSVDGYSLDIRDVPRSDKRLFLAAILDISDFEWLCQSENRLDAGIKEYEKNMQELIDENINDMWHESMQEHGMKKGYHADNGEIYYY